jgi:thiol:disulfide interchange protein DsbD
MKKVLLLFLCLAALFTNAQPKQFVTWKFSQKKISPTEFELQFKATIEKGWHLYSQVETPDIITRHDGTRLIVKILEDNDEVVKYRKVNSPNARGTNIPKKDVKSVAYADGPLPTLFEFERSENYSLSGSTTEPRPHEVREPLFSDSIVRSFDNSAVFKQKIKALTGKPFTVKGIIDGMTCNDNTCQKFSPPVEFEFTITGAEVAAAVTGDTISTVAEDTLAEKDTVTAISKSTTPAGAFRPSPPSPHTNTYWGLFIAGFLGGLAALLTPCVFPMIPMTVSFFTKQSKTRASGIRNAIVYSISIIAIYITLGLGVTLIFGADAMNNLATNVWFNLAFFALLVVFAVSFLGAFEITLPSGFVNRMDARSEKGGYLGIFFMAFTLGLVSFSCTGPIIGTLLVQAASTRALAGPFFGMFGFSLALALPFGLFAAFPGWLNSLPKSGGWLNSVKVALGFLELALAMKFLSNADLVVQAGIITRELFLVVWIVIFALMGAYLMGWFKMSHDSDLRHVPVGRLMLAILTFSFTFYLIPGLWGAPLKLISGFPPPDFYSESPEGFGGSRRAENENAGTHAELPDHAHRGPNGIPAFDDYYHGLAYAKKMNKPLMIDFTGWACVNCRKMEGQVWSDPDVKARLTEDFVLVSLYVDDKKHLSEDLKKEVMWNGSRRRLKTVGDRWSYLQNTQYASSTQPQYWIIDANGNHYSDSTSYDPDIQKYIHWLDAGLEKFRQR